LKIKKPLLDSDTLFSEMHVCLAFERCRIGVPRHTSSKTSIQKHPPPTIMNGGVFYTDQATEIIIDPQAQRPLPTQNMLLDSLRRCNDLVQRDMRYAHLVAGASKMPMSMIWSARNQDELVNDSDLAKLKDLTWNEFIKKRYLPAIAGGSSLSSTASSMLEIVREMNLQRRRFQIMGLHEQVEASEIQLVLHLCQAQILRPTTSSDYYRSLANRFRRHDRFYEAFALAVGAFVCSSAPYTLGAATTRYERDLQFEYKKHTTALFVYVLQQYPGMVGEAGVYDEDYVLRISRLIVVWPSAGGDDWFDGGSDVLHSFPGAPPPTSTPPDKDMLLNAVVAAQTQAEKAERTASKAQREMLRTVADASDKVKTSIETIDERVDAVQEEVGTAVRDLREGLGRAKLEEELRMVTLTLQLKEMIFTLLGVRQGADGVASENVFSAVKETLKKEMDDKIERLGSDGARVKKEMEDKIIALANEGVSTKKEMDRKIEDLITEDKRLDRMVTDAVGHAEARLNASIGTSCTAVEGRLDAKMRPLQDANAILQQFQVNATVEIKAHKAQLEALIQQIQSITGAQPNPQSDNSAAAVGAAVGAFMANPNTGLSIWASNISIHKNSSRSQAVIIRDHNSYTWYPHSRHCDPYCRNCDPHYSASVATAGNRQTYSGNWRRENRRNCSLCCFRRTEK